MRNLTKTIPVTGFIILTLMVMVLLISAATEAWFIHPAFGVIASIVVIGALAAIYFQGKGLIIQEIATVNSSRKLFEFLAVLIGGIAAYSLSHDIGLGAVVAASLVAIIADMVLPKYGVPAYCGAFVGMSSNALLFNHTEAALASGIAGIVYVITRDVFSGFGGKLGTIAFIGAASTGLILGREFLIVSIGSLDSNIWVLLIAFIATPLTFFLNCYLGNGPVLASGAVGLIGGLILPILFPQNGNTLAVVAICASFTGMSNKIRCPHIWHILIAGLFTGILFIFSTPLLGGAGGKLGTIAFASIISTWGFTQVYQQLYRTDANDLPIH